MLTLEPVPRVLVPVDSAAAQRISAPNYDEFQSDREIWDLLQEKPDCVLRITMPHCHVADAQNIGAEGDAAALNHAAAEMTLLAEGSLSREERSVLWVYEVVSPARPQVRQVGVGGFARTAEIRTEQTPRGCIIRNEGIRPQKASGRARLIDATRSYIGTVNCAVRDETGGLTQLLESLADSRECSFAATDEAGNRHRVWLITDPAEIEQLRGQLAQEPAAYVADGNHRSAAAAELGREHFLAVFFPTSRLHLEPYNRLLPSCGVSADSLLARLQEHFTVTPLGDRDSFRPETVHRIALYLPDAGWFELQPLSGSFDETDAAASIDAAIVQHRILDEILGLTDPRDARINYVGGNKDAAYLKARVDSGDYDLAISLAPVTMEQFVAVCEQNRFMPPKSTWFDPKIRSGLVMALLEEN